LQGSVRDKEKSQRKPAKSKGTKERLVTVERETEMRHDKYTLSSKLTLAIRLFLVVSPKLAAAVQQEQEQQQKKKEKEQEKEKEKEK
jgi:hypothetical protein